MKSKVLISRRIPQEAIDLLKSETDLELWDDDMPPSREVFLDKARNIEGLLCLLTERIDAEFFDAAKKIKVVANMAVGYDNIDAGEATRRGVPCANTPEVLTDTTADLAWTLLMCAARRVVEGVDYIRAGSWKTWGPLLLLGQDIHHATLGLIGLGRIGSGMARRAQGFNMRVIYYDMYRRKDLEEQLGIEYADMNTVLKEADFVSVHVPLTKDTHHLISTPQFKLMKKTAVLVNSARGPIVDPTALYEALKSGEIFAAGLDVTEPEPINMDNPLLTLENCVIVPHIASGSIETRKEMGLMAARNVLAGLNGERLPNIVNPEVYDKK